MPADERKGYLRTRPANEGKGFLRAMPADERKSFLRTRHANEGKGFLRAMPADERKGFAFPGVFDNYCGYAAGWRRSLMDFGESAGKAKPFRSSGGTAASTSRKTQSLSAHRAAQPQLPKNG